ncbi:uncharacterized protein LOC106753273, partial [Vigna radiata var. radiata]|uniref:Uncharacterized protein LOC106753273 n=1 Tax=Vigna radiata var. radiata TaxID=3916 RepID=A0A1S3T9U8_VIGRR
MYRQVWIKEEHRSLQRILWRDSPNMKIQVYELNTVTYGTTSAPFLAIRSLREAATRERSKHPQAAESILSSFYVDDFLGGGETVNEVKMLKIDVEKILTPYGFDLRKWASNNSSVLQECQNHQEALYFNTEEEVKVLGIEWNPNCDTFCFNSVPPSTLHTKLTKRIILAESSKLYDPLGFASPIVIRAKFLLQKLWQLKLDWDVIAPSELARQWLQLREEMIYLKGIKISRHLQISRRCTSFVVHGFSDASLQGYGACLYAVCKNDEGVTSSLICSKSRVAPLKPCSLPRLELAAALLLIRLTRKVVAALKTKPAKLYFWSDSTITLHWINSTANRWN